MCYFPHYLMPLLCLGHVKFNYVIHFAHRFSIGLVLIMPHLEPLAGEMGMDRKNNHVSLSRYLEHIWCLRHVMSDCLICLAVWTAPRGATPINLGRGSQ